MPGYWLRDFTKICVTMKFPLNASKKATSIVMNYESPSLYAALHSGVNNTWQADFSAIETPANIDIGCLLQGFNMPGPWGIKSRIGVATQPSNSCTSPYFVRGVGIRCYWQGCPKLHCGELIIGQPPIAMETYPAFCRIYIQ